jgi:carbon starvation protein
MFGIANQLLAVVAMCVATTVLFNSGRSRYWPVTLLPLAFIISTTLTAGTQMIIRFSKQANFEDDAGRRAALNMFLTSVMLSCVVVVLLDSIQRWFNPRPPEYSRVDPAAPLGPVPAAGE